MRHVLALAVLGLLAACFEPVGLPTDDGGTTRWDAGGPAMIDAGVIPPSHDAEVVQACPEGCDDGDPCTADSCDSHKGCVHPKEPDGTPCPGGRRCLAGACCAQSEVCDSGADDDCDGLTDCADPECQPRAHAPGKICDGVGNTCSFPGREGSKCEICLGNGGLFEPLESWECDDGHDNDCDGKVDCQDPSCAGRYCDRPSGKVCNGTTHQCGCPRDATREEVCDDFVDDDCDGFVDCQDTDCPIGAACGGWSETLGNKCGLVGGNRECVCSGNGGTPETGREGTCADGFDNDCDGQIDCFDEDCVGKGCGAEGRMCLVTYRCGCPPGFVEDFTGSCICGTGIAEVCDDGVDNNCDTKVDCADPLCAGKRCTIVSTGTKGMCLGVVCACPNVAEKCDDGLDDDCDGVADCEDTDCQPSAGFGGKCDQQGNTCSPMFDGHSSCSVCSGNGANPEVAESTCGDGIDNDCDGLVDCQDPGCVGNVCNAAKSQICTANGFCRCPRSALSETVCDDLVDDDCDGLVDCTDPDCPVAAACRVAGQPSVGMKCAVSGASRACVCSGNGSTPEAKELSCQDGHDNDCDGLLDCSDPDCSLRMCAFGGKLCDWEKKTCGCPAGQVELAGICTCSLGAPEVCEDGADNDCDGTIDCADQSCDGQACKRISGTKGKCSAGVCVCPNVPEDCDDGVDDDCDGLADCEDMECQPVGNSLGRVCDAWGHTCSAPVDGLSRCDVCSGNGAEPEPVESSCADAADNDCDGMTDCADSDCAASPSCP